MKNKLIRLGALVASAVLLAVSLPIQSKAEVEDKSYTYIYDYWGNVQDMPDVYSVCKVFTSADLGLDVKFKNPSGMFVSGNLIYICDSGNNRIVVLERKGQDALEVVQIIDEFKGDVEVTTFNNPTDIAISDEGNIFIADKGNSRVLKLDSELNYILQFDMPDDSSIDEDATFSPNKIVIDTAERVYCIADGINKGLIKYEPDAVFSGFIGATEVTYNFYDYIWKKFASQEQRAQMESFVPTEYDNIYIDREGFIYACSGSFESEDLDSGQADAIRKLNMLGSDILVRNGEQEVYGDLYWGSGGGYTGPSFFQDVTVLDNDIYICLDKNRGRLFGYDDQGNQVFIFGGNGNMDGYFRSPSAIEHMNDDLLVLDAIDCSITLFIPTEFGSLVYDAMEEFDAGEYEVSGESWEKVMQLDGNYTLAYIGIGRSLLRQKDFHAAMQYFKLKYDDENYSKAFQQYRKEWVEEHIAIIVIIILAIFLIPLGIGRIKKIKRDIDFDDYLNRNRK